MKSYYVYILTTKYNKLLYIGVTNDLVRRVYEHRNHLNQWFTSKYNIHKLVYYEETWDINIAVQREKELKWKMRYKKIELINTVNPEWKDLYDELV